MADLVVQLLHRADLSLQARGERPGVTGVGEGHVWDGAGILTDRGAVDVEGIQDVAFGDGICNRAIGSLIPVQGLHSDEGGVECGGTFIEGHLVQLLSESRSVVVLVQDGDVHCRGGLWDMGTLC